MEVTFGDSLTISGRVARRFDTHHQFGQLRRISTEDQPAMPGVWTRGVKFIRRDAFGGVQLLDDGEVVVHRVAEDIGNASCAAVAAQRRQLLRNKRGDTHILQADGVDHAG